MAAMISALAKKLGVKPGMSAVVVNPPDDVLDLFQPLPEGATVSAGSAGTSADLVLIFARNASDVTAALPDAVPVAGSGLLWIAYPKGGKRVGTDLNRDILWQQVQGSGLAGVTLVAVDDTWSAMRFRPAEQVGT
jgi:hypothetical protein